MDFAENTGLLLKAIRFSAEKHRNQRRKDNAQSPYINHPIEVGQLLWDVGTGRNRRRPREWPAVSSWCTSLGCVAPA